MFLMYMYSMDCVGISGRTPPEPDRMIGSSLPLTSLVMCHQVPRGCPFTESDTN
jgi:hypothetical protein